MADQERTTSRLAEVVTNTLMLFFFLSAMGFWLMLLGHSFLGVHPIGRVEIRWVTEAHEEAPAGAFTSRRGPRTDTPREAEPALSDPLAR